MIEIENIRKNFPICEEQYYFDAAGVSPLPLSVKSAIESQLELRLTRGKLGVKSTAHSLTEQVRFYCAKLINSKPHQIALTTNTTQGLNIVAQGLTWKAGDEILIPDNEYPANQYPWLALTDRGVVVKKIPTINGQINIEDIESKITPKTKLLSISHVGYISGYQSDLKAIGNICLANNILFVVDAAQSMGAIPIDVVDCNISALSCSAWKWLLGPIGQGVLFCNENLTDQLQPCFVGEGSIALDQSHNPEWPTTYKKGAERFMFSSLDISGVAGFSASLKIIDELGVNHINNYVKKITKELFDELTVLKSTFSFPFNYTNINNGIISVKPLYKKSDQLCTELLKANIHCANWFGFLRFSPYIYNNSQDIEYLIKTLRSLDLSHE